MEIFVKIVKSFQPLFSQKALLEIFELVVISALRSSYVLFNPLSANPTKWQNTLKQFVSNSRPTSCLSMFDHFVGLALKGLRKAFRLLSVMAETNQLTSTPTNTTQD